MKNNFVKTLSVNSKKNYLRIRGDVMYVSAEAFRYLDKPELVEIWIEQETKRIKIIKTNEKGNYSVTSSGQSDAKVIWSSNFRDFPQGSYFYKGNFIYEKAN